MFALHSPPHTHTFFLQPLYFVSATYEKDSKTWDIAKCHFGKGVSYPRPPLFLKRFVLWETGLLQGQCYHRVTDLQLLQDEPPALQALIFNTQGIGGGGLDSRPMLIQAPK